MVKRNERIVYKKVSKLLLILIFGWFVYLIVLVDKPATEAQDLSFEPGAIMLDRAGIPMVYVPPARYMVGIDPVRLRELCEARGESDADRCVEIIEEDTGATYTYNVDLPAFWIDRYEVTIEQFSQVCTANYIWFPEGCVDRQLPPEVTSLLNQPQLG
jgi:formylglycine-generating enzyme required for sulfatase activity